MDSRLKIEKETFYSNNTGNPNAEHSEYDEIIAQAKAEKHIRARRWLNLTSLITERLVAG